MTNLDKKTCFEYYLAESTAQFCRIYDPEKSWARLQHRLSMRRRIRIATRTLLAGAAVLLLGWILFPPQDDLFKTEPRLSYDFPERGKSGARLTLPTGQIADLTHLSGKTILPGAVSEVWDADNHRLICSPKSQTKPTPKESAAETYRLTVPRGYEYRVVLSDGTSVRLNAESSLSYPAYFSGSKREVTLHYGEACFEVAHDPQHPFILHSGQVCVEVLGTRFNLSAYPKQPQITTLIHGKVKVSTPTGESILYPGQQLTLLPGENIPPLVKEVDAAEYAAWTQGQFIFRSMKLADIAAQLQRWYNVEIRFGNSSLQQRKFTGMINRRETLGHALEIIGRVSDVKFVRREGYLEIIE